VVSKIEYVLIDDLDGTQADETVTFSLDGRHFEIDLNDAHAAELRECLAPYLDAARSVRPASARARAGTGRTAGPKGPSEMTLARAWAREQGMPVNQRGKLPAHVLAAYRAAHAD